MKIRFDFNNMMSEVLGPEGISKEEITAILPQIEKAKAAMEEKHRAGKMDWRDLPYNHIETAKEIKQYVSAVKDDFDAFVVLGIGGSALGPMMVQQAINHPYWNELTREKRGGYPKLYIADNVDPERLVYLFETVDITKCLFNVISKSGSTS